jgi:hypothetical protein
MPSLAGTRRDLQRVAVHLLARRRHAVSGRFGLRATPGGIGTPAFGPPDSIEVVRVTSTSLVHEIGNEVRSHPLEDTTLASLASLVEVDLAAPFSVGRDTPEVGDPSAALRIDPQIVAELADWWNLGWRTLDRIVETADRPERVQLWPEHFDVGTTVAFGPAADDRVSLGASPGDHHHDEPYLYVQPWTGERPGEPSFWNSSFGAVLGREQVTSLDDGVSFFRTGLGELSGHRPAR